MHLNLNYLQKNSHSDQDGYCYSSRKHAKRGICSVFFRYIDFGIHLDIDVGEGI